MAPLPENNTAVFFLDYTTCGYDHTMQVRYDDPNTADDAMTDLDAYLTALGNSHRLMTITGARNRANGATVSTDITWTGAATYGAGAGSPHESAYYYDAIGRTLSGRRVRVAVFGAILTVENGKYRAFAADDAAFSAGLAVLNGVEGTFLGIDGQQPTWKQYFNMGPNAYWRNKIR